jgi:hypothetical protein
MSFGSVLGGVLALSLLEATVTSAQATDRVGDIWTMLASGINRVLDPTVPAIPDLRSVGSTAGAGAAAGGTTATNMSDEEDPNGMSAVPDWTTGAAGTATVPTSTTAIPT